MFFLSFFKVQKYCAENKKDSKKSQQNFQKHRRNQTFVQEEIILSLDHSFGIAAESQWNRSEIAESR